MEFDYNLNALKIAGFILPNEIKPSKKLKFWNAFTIVPFIIMHLLVVIEFFYKEASFYGKVIQIYHMFNGGITIYRRLYFIFREREITELLDLFKIPPSSENPAFSRSETEMRQQSTKHIRRYSFLTFVYTAGVIVMVVGAFLIFRTVSAFLGPASQKKGAPFRLIIYIMWWPTNIRATPTYYFIAAWQCWTVMTYMTISCTTDAFTCALMLAAAERSSFLARTAPKWLLPGPRGDVTKKFRTWVKYHQHYLEIVNKLNALVGPLIFISYLYALLTFICFSYMILKIAEKVTQIGILICISGNLMQIFIISKAGQKIIDNSVQLSRSVMGAVSRGGLKQGPARSALSVVVTRLSGGNNFEFVSGLGFFAVSIEYFSSILSASISYFLFLLNFKSPGPKEQNW